LSVCFFLPTLLGAQPPNYPKDYNRVETWGNLLDRFVWMFVHLTQKKVVGTARCLIPTLNSINRALLHCILYRLCLLPEPGVTCSYANICYLVHLLQPPW